MKTRYIIYGLLCGLIALFTVSCSTLRELGYAPEFKMQQVSLKGLDFEGITFNCEYAITNPYPLAFSIQKVDASVNCSEASYIKLSADKGITVEANGKRSNSFTFKVPYSTILSIAKDTNGKESLPFAIKGSAYLDTSAIPLLDDSLELPFSMNFEVPVFKPNFSVSNPRIEKPSLTEIRDALSDSGVALTKAITIASQVIGGKSLSDAIFDNVNLNFGFMFDLNVANEGNSSWQCNLNTCSVRSGDRNLIDLGLGEKGQLTASSNKVPVKATLNTLNTGKYVVQMLNKKGTDPVFTVESKLSFPKLKYAKDIPLTYTVTIPLSKINTEN